MGRWVDYGDAGPSRFRFRGCAGAPLSATIRLAPADATCTPVLRVSSVCCWSMGEPLTWFNWACFGVCGFEIRLTVRAVA